MTRSTVLAVLLVLPLSSPAAMSEPVRVVVWDEQQPEQKSA
jgi:hypothetical protein